MADGKLGVYTPNYIRHIKLEGKDTDDDLHMSVSVEEDGSLFFNFHPLVNPLTHYMLGDLKLNKESAQKFIRSITVID